MKWQPPDTSSHLMSTEIFYDPPNEPFVGWVYDREGDVIFWDVHEDAMNKMQERINFLENVLTEYEEMLRR